MMQYYRDRARKATAKIEDVQNEQTVRETKKAFKKPSAGVKEVGEGDDKDETGLSRWKL